MIKNKLSIVSWGIPCPLTANVHEGRLERELVLTVKETNFDARILYLKSQFGSLFRCRCIPYTAIQELGRDNQLKVTNLTSQVYCRTHHPAV